MDEECCLRWGSFGLLVDGVEKTFLVDRREWHFVVYIKIINQYEIALQLCKNSQRICIKV